jgi:hypothetical protein
LATATKDARLVGVILWIACAAGVGVAAGYAFVRFEPAPSDSKG